MSLMTNPLQLFRIDTQFQANKAILKQIMILVIGTGSLTGTYI